MQQPLSHGRVDPRIGIDDVVNKLLTNGIKLGETLMSGEMPSTSEWVYGGIDIVAGGLLAINTWETVGWIRWDFI